MVENNFFFYEFPKNENELYTEIEKSFTVSLNECFDNSEKYRQVYPEQYTKGFHETEENKNDVKNFIYLNIKKHLIIKNSQIIHSFLIDNNICFLYNFLLEMEDKMNIIDNCSSVLSKRFYFYKYQEYIKQVYSLDMAHSKIYSADFLQLINADIVRDNFLKEDKFDCKSENVYIYSSKDRHFAEEKYSFKFPKNRVWSEIPTLNLNSNMILLSLHHGSIDYKEKFLQISYIYMSILRYRFYESVILNGSQIVKDFLNKALDVNLLSNNFYKFHYGYEKFQLQPEIHEIFFNILNLRVIYLFNSENLFLSKQHCSLQDYKYYLDFFRFFPGLYLGINFENDKIIITPFNDTDLNFKELLINYNNLLNQNMIIDNDNFLKEFKKITNENLFNLSKTLFHYKKFNQTKKTINTNITMNTVIFSENMNYDLTKKYANEHGILKTQMEILTNVKTEDINKLIQEFLEKDFFYILNHFYNKFLMLIFLHMKVDKSDVRLSVNNLLSVDINHNLLKLNNNMDYQPMIELCEEIKKEFYFNTKTITITETNAITTITKKIGNLYIPLYITDINQKDLTVINTNNKVIKF